MRIEKLEFVKNIHKFENNSDEYVEINLNRKVTELSSVSYEKKLNHKRNKKWRIL